MRKFWAGCVLLALATLGLSLPSSVAAEPEDLPDLLPLFVEGQAHFEIGMDDNENARALRFDTYILNAGSLPLEIRGLLADDPWRAHASQCVRFDGPACAEEHQAGTLRWFAPDWIERCFSFEGIARYELRELVDGEPDQRPDGLVAEREVSFALEDDIPWGEFNAGPPAYFYCAGFLRQGLSVGYVSTRAHDDRGQFLELGGRNGRFALIIRVDPHGHIKQASTSNDGLVIPIHVLGSRVEVLS